MKKKFWFQLLALIAIVTCLAFYRTSEHKIKEQDFIAALQLKQSPASIRFFQIVSDSISFISLGIPAVVLAFGLYRKRKIWVRQGLIILLGIALGGLISATLKRTIKEPRPYEVDARISQWSVGGSNSFPSGHTVEATAAAIGFSTLLMRTPPVMLLSMIWALLIMFSRIVLGVHNFTDILGGIAVGCMGLLIVHDLFERRPLRE
ncbi:MAG: phosphatase PAP2 family protein [Cytophagales bacterium]|nr:phosphatase PAP2 family protein [Cytophagales bacterium]